MYPYMADRCYKFHATPRSWHDAFKVCLAERAHLVILNSLQEAQHCAKTFNEYPNKSVKGNNQFNMWFGFNDLVVPGEFKTIEGMFTRI